MRAVAGVVGRTLGLAVVWIIAARVSMLATDPVLPPDVGRWVVLVASLAAVAWMWRWWHRRTREVAAERLEAEVRAGSELRRNDSARYREVLEGAKDYLADTDRDRYVGRVVTALPAPRRWEWNPPTVEQEARVGILAKELENAALVRTIEDGAAEVLGVKDCVAYRYRVDAQGGTPVLLSTDTSRVRWLRINGILAVTGLLLFFGGIVLAFIVDHDGRIPNWLAPFPIGGFVLAFVGIFMTQGGPMNFLPPGEKWQQAGSG